MAQIISFSKRKPFNIQPYIDFDKGWKFTEADKEFLINYYEDMIKVLMEECSGDFVEDYQKILNSINENGVEASKEMIQDDAKFTAESVHYEIYEYYNDAFDILRLIENSILDLQW